GHAILCLVGAARLGTVHLDEGFRRLEIAPFTGDAIELDQSHDLAGVEDDMRQAVITRRPEGAMQEVAHLCGYLQEGRLASSAMVGAGCGEQVAYNVDL